MSTSVDLVASFFTLSGAGFGQPPRHGFADRCYAAAQAGFTGIGLHLDDLDRTLAAGLTITDMQAILADNGLRLVEIEFLSGWAVHPDSVAIAAAEDKVYRIADALGGRHISAGEFTADDGGFEPEAAAAQLAQIAGRAARHDLLIAIEAFPWSPLRDIRTASQVLDLADAPNAGLLIDVWHFFNCGATVDDLNTMPAGRVTAVQLNDGPRVHDNFLHNARATRWLPGDGDLDVVGLVRTLQRRGFTGPYCVEVNNPEFRELPIAEAARQAVDRTKAILRIASAT